MGSDLHPEDRTAWLLLIGRRLRAEYDVVAEPVPPRLAALIEQLETGAPDAGDAGEPDRGNHEGANHDTGNHHTAAGSQDKTSARSAGAQRARRV